MSTTLPSGNIISTTTYGGEEYQNINVTFAAGGIQSTVTADNPFPVIGSDDDTILLALTRILGALPRINSQGQVAVNLTETQATVALAASQTLATLTALTRLESFGSTARPTDAIPNHISNAGTATIYANLVST